MKCPNCGSDQTYCINSRSIKRGTQRRRRHRCFECDHIFGTFELYDKDIVALERVGKRLDDVLERLRDIVGEEVQSE